MISYEPKIMPYKYILLIAMLFITVDISAVSVAYKMVSFNELLAINSAATFIFPITYALGDIVAEVYGYNMARKLIWSSLLLQFVYALLVTSSIHLPSPAYWHDDAAYSIVFGSALRFVAAGTIANLVSSFMNVYLVSKLKIPMEGKFFWARSIFSTLVSGFIMVSLIILFGFTGEKLSLLNSWIMFKSTYTCEVVYAIGLAVPAAIVAKFLKKSENIDVYDHNTSFNPFNFKLNTLIG